MLSVVVVVGQEGSACQVSSLGPRKEAAISRSSLNCKVVVSISWWRRLSVFVFVQRNGGSVEYLHNHNNKPFIRGGDFAFRKSRGEQPMQLQYSRAFGVRPTYV